MKKIIRLFFVLGITVYCKAQDQPPNIIWLVCEDQSVDFFPMYGDSTVSLPNLEALTEESVVYTNMHATTPVCSPARSAIITGRYPTSIGTHNMRTYRYQYGATENQPQLGIPVYSPQPAEDTPAFTTYLRDEGYFCTNRDKMDYNFLISDQAWDVTCHQRYCNEDNLYARAHWRSAENNQPFFSVFNFSITHESQIWNNQKLTLEIDPQVVNVPPYFPNDSIVRHDLAVNYSNLIKMDQQIGLIIDQLKEDGLYDNSFIFFYSDHGGPFPRHKRAINQSGTKVPLIVKFPKAQFAGTLDGRLLSFIDFAPTLLNIVGIEKPSHLQGQSFIGPNQPKERTYLVTASDRFDGQVDRVRAVQTQQYKYVKNYHVSKPHALDVKYRKNMPMMRRMLELLKEGKLNENQMKWFQVPKANEEFYDLLNDPYELHNLADQKKYKKIKKQMAQELEKWIALTDDLGRFPESELGLY